jgi:Leucine-rich repeat (LRR) protein
MLSDPLDEQLKRLSVLRRKHIVEFAGPLASITLRNSWRFSWGFLSGCTFAGNVSLRPALEHPLARFLEAVDFQRGVDDLGPLSLLTGLRELDIRNSRVIDLGPIAKLGHLTTLSLYGGGLQNLETLAELVELTTLQISGCKTTDLAPIVGLPKLRELTVNILVRIEELGMLTSLTGLEMLDLRGSFIEDELVEELTDALPNVEIHH